MRRILISVVAYALATVIAQSASANEPANDLTEQKRKWLFAGLTAQMKDPIQIHQARAKLERMSLQQIDQLVAQVNQRIAQSQQQRLDQAQRQYQQALAAREQLTRQLQAQRRGVGFAPVITTLPQGTSLGVGAVVSPDRRYVRINATPFFSRIGRVHTFNLKTGETKRIK